MSTLFTVCIPSYNRPSELIRLLESLKIQNGNFNILIAEDNSPRRLEIIEQVNKFINNNLNIDIRLILNEKNQGYDGNLRNLIENANGAYCLFMGDDDVINEGAISKIQDKIQEYKDIGFLLRGWEEVDIKGDSISIQRYYEKDLQFPKGEDTVVHFFRKSVFISGLVVHRESALKYSTNIFDGKLLYQLYLLSNILLDKDGYYISDILTKRISGAEHYFGSAESEKGKFEPKKLTIEHSLNFMKGFIDIIQHIDEMRNTNMTNRVLTDLSKYSYGFLSIQRENGILAFIKYAYALKKMKLGITFHFYCYFILLLIFGYKFSNKLFSSVKRKISHTPNF